MQGLHHAAEEHDIHALGVAQILCDLLRVQDQAAVMGLHGLQAALGILAETGRDAGGGHLIVVDDGNAVGF